MSKKLAALFVGVGLAASLSVGAAFASYTTSDEANPFGVKIALTSSEPTPGYYLVGDETFMGSSETAWSMTEGFKMNDTDLSSENNVAELNNVVIAANSILTIRHYIAPGSDEYFHSLGTDYSFVTEYTDGDGNTNLKFTVASTYSFYLNNSDNGNKLWIVDELAIDNGYYLVKDDGTRVASDPDYEGSDLGQWTSSFDVNAGDTFTFVNVTDSHTLTPVSFALRTNYDYASVSADTLTITRTSSHYKFYLYEYDNAVLLSIVDDTLPNNGYYYLTGTYDIEAASTIALPNSSVANDASFKIAYWDGCALSYLTALASGSEEFASISNGLVTMNGATDHTYSVSVSEDKIVIADNNPDTLDAGYYIVGDASFAGEEAWAPLPTYLMNEENLDSGNIADYTTALSIEAGTAITIVQVDDNEDESYFLTGETIIGNTNYGFAKQTTTTVGGESVTTITFTRTSTYKFYLTSSALHITDENPATAGYYILGDGDFVSSEGFDWCIAGAKMLDDTVTGTDKAKEEEFVLTQESTIRISYYDGQKMTWDVDCVSETSNYGTISGSNIKLGAGAWNFYVNKDGVLWISNGISVGFTVTLKIENITWWYNDGSALTYVYWFGGSVSSSWPGAKMSGSSGTYTYAIPANAGTHIIFVRVNPNNTSESWNQSIDISLADRGKSTTYELNSQYSSDDGGKCYGSWVY